MLPADISKSRPKQVHAGGEAQGTYDGHPDPGNDVDAALGDGADPTFLTPASAQQGVGAYNEASYTCEREQGAEGHNGTHVLYPSFLARTIRERRVRKRGSARKGANSRALVKCSTSLSPASTAFSM